MAALLSSCRWGPEMTDKPIAGEKGFIERLDERHLLCHSCFFQARDFRCLSGVFGSNNRTRGCFRLVVFSFGHCEFLESHLWYFMSAGGALKFQRRTFQRRTRDAQPGVPIERCVREARQSIFILW
jgi:hypothetical protein